MVPKISPDRLHQHHHPTSRFRAHLDMMGGCVSQKHVSLEMQRVQQSSAPTQLGVQHSEVSRTEPNQTGHHACESRPGDSSARSSAVPKPSLSADPAGKTHRALCGCGVERGSSARSADIREFLADHLSCVKRWVLLLL